MQRPSFALSAFILAFCAFCAAAVFAATAKAQTVCDVAYSVETQTADERDVANSKLVIYGVPFADVEDNSAKGMRTLKVAAAMQDKGGPYTIEFSESRSCDGKPYEKFAANSIEVRGVTLDGSNRIARMALKQANEIVERYEKRAAKGEREAWKHDKARKVKRNDLHVKQW